MFVCTALPIAPPAAPTARSTKAALTGDTFCAWLGNAMPGDCLEYHRGFLACDRDPDQRTLTPADRRRVDALADQVREMAAIGLVALIQRRLGEADFSYLAIKARRVS